MPTRSCRPTEPGIRATRCSLRSQPASLSQARYSSVRTRPRPEALNQSAFTLGGMGNSIVVIICGLRPRRGLGDEATIVASGICILWSWLAWEFRNDFGNSAAFIAGLRSFDVAKVQFLGLM